MTEQYNKLKETLAEIFQLDQADLDFGIYRIMNQKRDDINAFLDHKLLQEVKESLARSSSGDSEELKKKLETMVNSLKEAGIDPDSNDKVAELKAQYLSTGSPEALINEVFSHLTSFFRRYYNQGDFISQRRYKKDVYAIPYEGEEVKLHWANHDQYYIKTGENFKNYSFNLSDGLKVSFVLRDASTEQNNNKSQQGTERRVKLAEEDIFSFENNEGQIVDSPELATHLKIWFTYDTQDKNVKQDDLRAAAAKLIKQQLPTQFQAGMLQLKATASNKERTLLDKHLQNYTAKNSFDYFIHKDLGGFLGRELDFYIKNEILQIDDINLDSPTSFERQLKIVKAFKSISKKLIALMAQLEEFQKKLWLKKKMVLQSDYCITVDRVPEEMYLDILTNQAQIQEWDKLFAISEIKKEEKTELFEQENISYSEVFQKNGSLIYDAESKGIVFLKANPFLVLDTQFFSREWKYSLLSTFENIDEQCNGLMINSENFQALEFLNKRMAGTIDNVYIDPPYNTENDRTNGSFIYKDTFEHSSWLSLMEDRLVSGFNLLSKDGVFLSSIDDDEFDLYSSLLRLKFGKKSHLGTFVWEKKRKGHF
jgi:adenine-specific DNA-methyltransferase